MVYGNIFLYPGSKEFEIVLTHKRDLMSTVCIFPVDLTPPPPTPPSFFYDNSKSISLRLFRLFDISTLYMPLTSGGLNA